MNERPLLEILEALGCSRPKERKLTFSQTKTYTCIANILARCTNATHPLFKYYGARGIRLDVRWLFDPMSFVVYLELLPGYNDPVTWIDRINNDGHYMPGNLRWCSASESANNRARENPVEPLYELTEALLQAAREARKGWTYRRNLRDVRLCDEWWY